MSGFLLNPYILGPSIISYQTIQYVGGKVLGLAGSDTSYTLDLTGLTGGISSTIAPNDLVIIGYGAGCQTNIGLGVTGFTNIANLYYNPVSYDTKLTVWYIFAADYITTATLSASGADNARAITVQVFRNVNQTNTFDVPTINGGTTSGGLLVNIPPITPITPGSYIVAIGGAGNGRGGFDPATYGSSDLTRFLTAKANDVNDFSIGAGYKAWTSGTFDPAQWTFDGYSSTNYCYAYSIMALKPAIA